MTRYIADYKIVSSSELRKDQDFSTVVSAYVRNGNWEPFGSPVLALSQFGELCFAQALVIFEGHD